MIYELRFDKEFTRDFNKLDKSIRDEADKINKERFFPDMNRNIRVKGTSEVIVPNMYIKIIILSRSFSDYDKNILVIGFMQDIATEEEIKEYMGNDLEENKNSNEYNIGLEDN
jgi:hypothetical protein